MVKLAQTIGASNIASSMRQPQHLLGAVVDVRQSIWTDEQERDAVRVFPFTDIQFNGAEAVRSNSVLASCMVPAIASVAADNGPKDMMWGKPTRLSRKQAEKAYSPMSMMEKGSNKKPWMVSRTGMVDYIFGLTEEASYNSIYGDEDRADTLSSTEVRNLGGTRSVSVQAYASEDEALDDITRNPGLLKLGYVQGPRDTKLYYTETAIAMMARRMRNVVEALSPYKPRLMPFGLGHIAEEGLNEDKPIVTPDDWERKNAKVWQPSLAWSAGNVAYKSSLIQADGTLYIPGDQIPYATRRKGFKYNHIMTQVGMELLDCLNAIGVDMNQDLTPASVSGAAKQAGVQECALQLLYASMFGTSASITAPGDFEVSEDIIASQIKEYLGSWFNSGHIHIDPGVMQYIRGEDGRSFASQINDLMGANTRKFKIRGEDVSGAQAMAEFIRAYFVWCVASAALSSYMTVPLLQCHWLYTNKMKPEYVIEQLQMNFRSDVYFDGDSALGYTLIPTRLNPGETLNRVPCYISNAPVNNGKDSFKPNAYLGIRDPLPYGPVEEIRFAGDRPLTTIDQREYTFSPVIEADSSVQSTFRNGRTVNFAQLPRPTTYVPGTTTLGAVYGLMADNKRVGGHYYYIPNEGVFSSVVKDDTDRKIYRATVNNPKESSEATAYLLAGQTTEDEKKHLDHWERNAVKPNDNYQNREANVSAATSQQLTENNPQAEAVATALDYKQAGQEEGDN